MKVDAATAPDVDDFLTWLSIEKGRSANTVSAYRRDLRRYLGFLEAQGLSLDRVATDDIVAFTHSLRSEGLAESSVARILATVRGLHRFRVAEGLADHDPTADAETPRIGRGLPRPLAEDEVTALLEHVSGPDPLARRDRALLELLYGTGVRISEAVGAGLGDLDPGAGLLRVMGKGGKERIVPIGRCAADALERWWSPEGRGALEPAQWASRDDAEALFLNHRGGRLSRQGAWGVLKKHGTAVGVGARLSPHVLRHSCATHMLDHGADVRTVQELLGHASITTTQVYTRVSTERLREVYRSAHPRGRG